jgi:metal-responsive CopG/Arc/MetJ family transcriptional regulator
MEEPVPRSTKILNISLSKELYEKIEDVALQENRTKSELVREAFRQYSANRNWSRIRQWGDETARKLQIKDEQDIDKILHEK